MKCIIMICILPLWLNAQQSTSMPKEGLDDRKKWEVLRQRIETAVDRGDISREEADKRYASFRARATGQRVERKDLVMESHFKRLGIDDIDELKNRLLDQDIPADQLDAVLGGMLRLVHAVKLDRENYRMNPRIEAYFKDRLGLTSSQANKILLISKEIVSGSF
ncbi:MAG: hypothetical protein QF780_03725 [Candidatus Marinimicrobia bacterium]|nr:hypothetical protein [Candidatus Neomarinimicrobiota bacterium]